MKTKLAMLGVILVQFFLLAKMQHQQTQLMTGWKHSISMVEQANKNTEDAQQACRDAQAIATKAIAFIKEMTPR